jgi:hypothetical protein
MPTLTIVVAPPGQRAVLGVLADWSACALLGGLAWLDTVPSDPAARFPALWLEEGRFTAVNLAVETTRLNPAGVRVVLLVPATSGAEQLSDDQQSAVVEALAQATNSRPSLVRLIVGVDELHLAVDQAGRRGAHNVILAAETSPEPGGSVPLPVDVDQATLAAHVASAVATLGGVWRSMDAAPLDDVPVSPSGWPQVFRTHFRGLLGDSAEASIRAETLATATKNPLPTTQERSEYIEDVNQATGDFARALLREHRKLMVSARVDPALEEVRGIKFGEALRMFFSFLASALNPIAWMKAQIAGAVDATAAALTAALFGGDSHYRISLWGSLDSRVSALDALDSGLARVIPKVHEPAGSFAPLWKDFVAGAFTLIDGGDRTSVLPPIRIGASVGVLRNAALSAPGPECDFVVDPSLGLPAHLASVPVVDHLAFREVGEHLKERSTGAAAQLADTEADRLQAWHDQYERTYTAKVGAYLGGQVERLSQEIDGYLAELVPQDDDLQRVTRMQRKVSRRLLILAGIAAALLLGSVLGGVFALVSWAVAGTIAAAVLVGWLVSSALVFMKGQRALFAEIHRRRTLVTRTQALQQNLRAASRDLRLCLDAYRQLLCWSDIVTAVLAEPFGRPEELTGQRGHGLEGLPQNVRVGEFRLDPDATLQTAAKLRRFFFRPNWLSTVWEKILDDVGRRVGPEAIDLMQEPELIFASRASADDPLPVWAAALQRDGTGRAAREQAWQVMVSELAGRRADYGLDLEGTVVEASRPPVPVGRFLARLTDLRPGGDFDRRSLQAEAVVNGAATVAGTPWLDDRQTLLSRVVVRAEFGPGFSPGLLALARDKDAGRVQPQRAEGGLL